DNIQIKMLIKPGAEIHSYDPTPQDLIAIQKSDLFVYNGGESDEWVDEILISMEENAPKTLRLIESVALLEEEHFDEEHFHEHEEECHHGHSAEELEADEHVWTSPENARKMVDFVAKALESLEELKFEDKAKIKENAEDYKNQIDEVESEIKQVLKSKSEKFIVMGDRFPLQYFAKYYGIEYIAAFSGCSTAVEASTQTIGKLIKTVEEKNLPAVFHIELSNHKIADTVAEAAKVATYQLNSVQNISKADFDNGETWVSLMKKNALALDNGMR
ncbi:MAG: metal ABC transporter substrate-binding protein, partial [Treponemataceae bacterium]|nr:metal ABC transporter substrate-binding protein [Treponemataceae bacterium]